MRLIISRSIRIFFVLSFICLNSGCNQSDSKTSEILSIPLELTIERFDEKFHLSNASDIPKLKKEHFYEMKKLRTQDLKFIGPEFQEVVSNR